jgi:transposase
LLGVERWAEIRRMKQVEGLSQREIHRHTGVHRDTIRKALASSERPRYGPRPPRPSKLDPFLLADEPTLSGVRIREELERLGHDGGKTILDDLLRELRPRFLPPPRSFQRTRYRPGGLAQFDLCEPRSEIPVGFGQTRRGYLVMCELPYSRAFAGALVFSKEFPDIAFGMTRCLARLGTLPAKLVWDREGAIAPKGRPTEDFLAFCGRLALGWVILDPGDCQAKGALERSHRFLHSNFEAGRRFANPLDFQHQLDGWCERINARVHRTTRAVVAERLAEERERMRPLPAALPETDRRFVMRVPAQPYLRFDRNDYSLDPRLVGRRVGVRVSQAEIAAFCLDSGALAARHARVFAGGLCFTDPAHQRALELLRGERRRRRTGPDVERYRAAWARRTGPSGTLAGRPYTGRHPRQHHALLVDEHRGFLGSSLLGEQGGLLRRQEHLDSVCHQRLSRRAVSTTAELGRARISPQPHPLQAARPRRPLRGLGTAATFFGRGSRRLQTTAQVANRGAATLRAPLLRSFASPDAQSRRPCFAPGSIISAPAASVPVRAEGRTKRRPLCLGERDPVPPLISCPLRTRTRRPEISSRHASFRSDAGTPSG